MKSNDTPQISGQSRWTVPRRRAAQLVLLGAFGLDTLLYGLVISFLPGHLLALGATPAGVGITFAAYAGGLFVATFPAGWLTDQVGARQAMLAGLTALLLATLLFAFAPGLPLLILARAAQGASGAVTWTAGLALISQLSQQEEQRTRLFGWALAAGNLGTLIGAPLGGVLYAWGGFRAPFLVAAGLVLLDGVGRVVALPGREQFTPARPEAGAICALLKRPGFLIGLVVTLVGTILLVAIDPVLPPLLTALFGLQPWAIGLIFGALTLSLIVTQPLVSRIRRRPETIIVIGLLADVPAFTILGLTSIFAPIMIALIVLMGAATFALVPALELLTTSGQNATLKGAVAYGAIYACYNLAFAGGMFLGPLLAGALSTWIGPQPGLAFLGLLPLILALCIGYSAYRLSH